uniref:2Fe-2S ferredoxin-type domain-containing protein n=1 Tax=uncultured bacterium contig00074 TaxID=1181553 RepID=A0A806K1A6_9BACT|nr:hypothetical protein [uncultured bacterium contig00074]
MKIIFTGEKPLCAEMKAGASLAEAARSASLDSEPIGSKHSCRGHGRCGACLVAIEAGMENLSAPDERESRLLRILKAKPSQRLACQAKAMNGDVSCRFG